MEGPSRISTRRLEPLNDRELVIAFKGGDARAYASIYREYRPLAESVCLRVLGNREDAQEAAQETMLRVFQGLPRFNGRYLLRAWVARIATNVCLDALRRRERRPDEIEAPSAEKLEAVASLTLHLRGEDPLEVIERQDESRKIRDLLYELPEHHRDALWMREFDGLSHEEIAAKLDMTAPQVKALLHRAKKSLKRAWDHKTDRASGWMLPLMLAPLSWFRRALNPARKVAIGEATPVLHLTVQPALVQASNALSEKFVAAAGAILVAGTIGIGAATIPARHHAHRVRAADPPAFSFDAMPALHRSVPHHVKPKAHPRPAVTAHTTTASGTRARHFHQRPRPELVRPTPDASTPSPADSPVASPSPTPSATQSDIPIGGASQTPSPAPAPIEPKGFSFQVSSALSGAPSCVCANDPRVLGSAVSATNEAVQSFAQRVNGAAVLAADGTRAWSLWLNQSSDDGLSQGMNFVLSTPSDSYGYTASGSRISVHRTEWGGWRYVYRGTYSIERSLTDSGGIFPQRGGYEMSIVFSWRQQRVVSASLRLL